MVNCTVPFGAAKPIMAKLEPSSIILHVVSSRCGQELFVSLADKDTFTDKVFIKDVLHLYK